MKTKNILAVVLLLFLSAGAAGSANEEYNVPSTLQTLENRVVSVRCGPMKPVAEGDNIVRFHGVIFRGQIVLATKHGTHGYDAFRVEERAAEALFRSALYDYMVVRVDPGYGLDTIKFARDVDPRDLLFMTEKQGNGWRWIGPGRLVEIGRTELTVCGLKVKRGDSGKPVFNQKGELVGLVQAMGKEYTYLLPASVIEEQLRAIDREIETYFFQ